MTIIQLLLLLAVSFLSFWITLFWLSIPLMIQIIIDQVIVQNSPETLQVLGLLLLIVTLIASVLEIGISALTAILIRNGLAKDIFLKVATTLPKVLVMLILMAIYSISLTVASSLLTALAGGTYYLLKRRKVRREPEHRAVVIPELLPLSFRLPLTLIVLFVLWFGTSEVLNGQLTLGQLIALIIFNIQFVSLMLNLAITITNSTKTRQI